MINNAMLHILDPRNDASPPIPCVSYMDKSEFPPVGVSANSAELDGVHYNPVNDVAFTALGKKITFNHLGSFLIPDLRQYANTCELLQFSCMIHSARSVYELAHQLPKVRDVKISVDSAQATYSEERSKCFSRTPRCPNVKTLRVVLNLDQQQCDDAFKICGKIKFVESILMHAGHSFPNMQNLVVRLPEHAKLVAAVNAVIDSFPELKTRTTTLKYTLSTGIDFFDMFRAHTMRGMPSDKSLCSDDDPSAELRSSVNRRLRDGYYVYTDEYVGAQSAYQRIMSPLPDLDSYFCETVEEFMGGSLGGPWQIKVNDFDHLLMRWFESLRR